MLSLDKVIELLAFFIYYSDMGSSQTAGSYHMEANSNQGLKPTNLSEKQLTLFPYCAIGTLLDKNMNIIGSASLIENNRTAVTCAHCIRNWSPDSSQVFKHQPVYFKSANRDFAWGLRKIKKYKIHKEYHKLINLSPQAYKKNRLKKDEQFFDKDIAVILLQQNDPTYKFFNFYEEEIEKHMKIELYSSVQIKTRANKLYYQYSGGTDDRASVNGSRIEYSIYSLDGFSGSAIMTQNQCTGRKELLGIHKCCSTRENKNTKHGIVFTKQILEEIKEMIADLSIVEMKSPLLWQPQTNYCFNLDKYIIKRNPNQPDSKSIKILFKEKPLEPNKIYYIDFFAHYDSINEQVYVGIMPASMKKISFVSFFGKAQSNQNQVFVYCTSSTNGGEANFYDEGIKLQMKHLFVEEQQSIKMTINLVKKQIEWNKSGRKLITSKEINLKKEISSQMYLFIALSAHAAIQVFDFEEVIYA